MLTAMGDVMREAYRRGWITTRDGNISVRQGGYFYITPTGVRKTTIQPENIAKVHVTVMEQSMPGEVFAGGISIEMDMHWLVQKHGKAKSVVHLHPTYTVAALHAGFDLQKIAAQFIELRRYTKVGPSVETLESGSTELALQTADALTDFDVVGQKSHGVTAKGANPWDAFEHIERLEHICQIVLASGVKP